MTDVQNRLQTAARDALKFADDNVGKAAVRLDRLLAGKSDLRVALALFFIKSITAPALPAAPAHPAAKPAKPTEKPTPKEKKTTARRREGRHRRPGTTGMPTPSQRKAEIGAAVLMQATFWDRKTRGGQKLGYLKIRELPALMNETRQAAGELVKRGYVDGADSIWCRKVYEHAVSSDPDATVRDSIKEDIAAKFYREAEIEAAIRMREGAEHLINLLATPMPPPPELAA